MRMTIAAKSAPKARRPWLWVLLASVVMTGLYLAAMIFLPAPAPILNQVVFSGKLDTGTPPKIDWPAGQQAAVGAIGFDVLASNGSDTPAPTASIAKVIASLAILKKHPLELGESGPTITLTASDVAIYQDYVAMGGSVAKVSAGEQISEYQALQEMLIPSADNMAKTMAIWAFGSESAYNDYANQMVADMGLKNTHVADASGISASTVSTAKDLVKIGEQALATPVIAQIVSQTEATVPVAGKIVTTNNVMGQSGIDGIKTGHTNASGGCFLFSATRDVSGAKVKIIGVIMGAPSIDTARASAPKLIDAAYSGFNQVTALDAGQEVGTVYVPWAKAVKITAQDSLAEVVWGGDDMSLALSMEPSAQAGQAGVAVFDGKSDLLLQNQSLPAPSVWWRVTHPLEIVRSVL